MSLILDALRKMELERKAKRSSAAETRTEVLNYRGNPPMPQRSSLLPVIGAVLLLSAAAVFFLYFRSVRPPTAASVSTSVAPPLASPAQSDTLQTSTQPLPPAQTVQPAAANRAAAVAAPPAKADEIRQASGGDDNIAVSGIAWQEERLLRRAVINGSLVGEGAEISGARIVEIRQNLVRFNRDGMTFEVNYPAGAGK